MENKKLSQMISESALCEIITEVQKKVGLEASTYILPGVLKALEEGSGIVREQILSDWLNVESCRVCSECGAIMQEGWYNVGKYACSDECVIKQDGISHEEFKRYQIYKSTIQSYLDNEGKNRKADDLTDDEIREIINEIIDNCDAYYTSWE